MTAIRVVRLWCDQRFPQPRTGTAGRTCHAEFNPDPESGWVSQISVMRREAAKAGWTHVRSNLGRAFDKDYCPDHKPAGETE